MLYAHVTSGTVDSVGQPPELVFLGGRWWDLRKRETSLLIQAGWFVVDESPRPADTATTTWDVTYVADPLGAGPVDQVWVERPKTPGEVRNAEVESARNVLLDQLASGVQSIIDARTAAQGDIDTANTLKTQADALSGQIATHITQMQTATPAATLAYITAMRDAVVVVAQRQKQIVDAMSAMYVYRRAVDQNAVTTDNALLWLARLASDNILDN